PSFRGSHTRASPHISGQIEALIPFVTTRPHSPDRYAHINNIVRFGTTSQGVTHPGTTPS
ncbi:hypothetical protein, partial [Flagellimonas alvinocaridis]|uniref:hypothetical protein n=1 Tax=Flagellimonas alvinocaridis TaxID=2530200 RepID=UPI001F3EA95B